MFTAHVRNDKECLQRVSALTERIIYLKIQNDFYIREDN